MALVGGDAPALFSFANQLRKRRQAIQDTAVKLGAFVEAANWVGPDRDRFVREWRGNHAPQIQQICNDLDGKADQIARHAQKQAETSA
ncbi:MAG TPA: hypothetical protein VNQ73_18205 [Ilumatobacter sp.]|nr:hypothetical protein [Ilumatobacter sp.]